MQVFFHFFGILFHAWQRGSPLSSLVNRKSSFHLWKWIYPECRGSAEWSHRILDKYGKIVGRAERRENLSTRSLSESAGKQWGLAMPRFPCRKNTVGSSMRIRPSSDDEKYSHSPFSFTAISNSGQTGNKSTIADRKSNTIDFVSSFSNSFCLSENVAVYSLIA